MTQRVFSPTVFRAVFVLLVGLLLSACSGERRPSVLLLTLDTTRVDALGCYGAQVQVTPNLDALAAEGVRFDWARTVTPTTLPAHTSMLTGLYPHRHTVRDNSLSAVPQSAVTVAERASAAGFATAAFVSAKVLDRAFGLDQGFAHYSQPPRDNHVVGSTGFSTRPAAATAQELLDWLRALPREREFFAWAHFFDPHQPWTADKRFLDAAGGNPYLAEVAAMDFAIGQIIDCLRELGRLDSTTIVVVGDHGEGLGEHGEDSHAYFVYDTTLRVPFLLRRHDRARAGEVVEGIVSVVDAAPTMCEALGIAAPPDPDGVSLWRHAPASDRGAYFESYYTFLRFGMAPIAGWVDSRGKYVHAPMPEFYDPLQAPQERRNLLEQHAERVSGYRDELARALARPALEVGASVASDSELMRSVSELGYLGAAGSSGELPSPLDPTDRPSPHQRADELRKCESAERMLARGRFADAERLLEDVLQRNPRNTFALEYLGHSQMRLGKFDAARASLEGALEYGPERAPILRALGFVLERLGDKSGALARLTRAAELDPSELETLRLLLRLAVQSGDEAAAARWREALALASER